MPAMDEAEARRLWRSADAVCFDVDSTVIQEEGVDELARFLGKAEEVAQLTKHAMGGSLEFREALKLRLDLLKPSVDDIRGLLGSQPLNLTPGISDLITRLQERDTKVFLVSGGFHCLIRPVARRLGIHYDNITANKLLFDFEGNYVGFDETQPTSASGGKGRALQRLIDEHKLQCVAMIGDGATDLEASPPAHVFIGYGGNVVRQRVKSDAAWFVTDFEELLTELDK